MRVATISTQHKLKRGSIQKLALQILGSACLNCGDDLYFRKADVLPSGCRCRAIGSAHRPFFPSSHVLCCAEAAIRRATIARTFCPLFMGKSLRFCERAAIAHLPWLKGIMTACRGIRSFIQGSAYKNKGVQDSRIVACATQQVAR